MFDKILILAGKRKKKEVSVKISEDENKILRCVNESGVFESEIMEKYSRLYPNRILIAGEKVIKRRIDIPETVASLVEKGCLLETKEVRANEKVSVFYLTHLGRELISK